LLASCESLIWSQASLLYSDAYYLTAASGAAGFHALNEDLASSMAKKHAAGMLM